MWYYQNHQRRGDTSVCIKMTTSQVMWSYHLGAMVIKDVESPSYTSFSKFSHLIDAREKWIDVIPHALGMIVRDNTAIYNSSMMGRFEHNNIHTPKWTSDRSICTWQNWLLHIPPTSKDWDIHLQHCIESMADLAPWSPSWRTRTINQLESPTSSFLLSP